jgi:hypothetical protein
MSADLVAGLIPTGSENGAAEGSAKDAGLH